MAVLCLTDTPQSIPCLDRILDAVESVLPNGCGLQVVDVSWVSRGPRDAAARKRDIPDAIMDLRSAFYAADHGLVIKGGRGNHGEAGATAAVRWLVVPPIAPLRSTPIALIAANCESNAEDPTSPILEKARAVQPPSSPLQLCGWKPTYAKRVTILARELLLARAPSGSSMRCLIVAEDVTGSAAGRESAKIAGLEAEVTSYEQALGVFAPGVFDVVILTGRGSARAELSARLRFLDRHVAVLEPD